MLLHQRIDYGAPTPGHNLYVTIPMSSTLWTTIESCNEDEGELKSLTFPSRIIDPDKQFSVVFTGVDTSGLLRRGLGSGRYRITWRTVADDEDPSPKETLVALPLAREVTLTYSYGNSNLLSLAVAGVDVVLDFDIPQRILSTSWFTPPFTASWTLETPRRILKGLLSGIWSSSLALIENPPVELIEDSPTAPLCCLFKRKTD